jgi:uncharacterized membrane protein
MDEIEIAPPPFLERHKRLLGVFAIAIAVATVWLMFWIMDVADGMKLDPPEWLGFIFGAGFLLTLLADFFAVIWGLHDLAYQLLPDGRFKTFVLYGTLPKLGNEQGEKPMTSDGMGSAAFAAATAPLYVIFGVAIIGLIILLFVGGIAAVGAVAGKFFGGWPPWAIVICVLLVAILLKNEKS